MAFIGRIIRGAAAGLAGATFAFGMAGSAAQAQDSLTIAQSSDAQPRNILPTRGGNLPWVRNVFEGLTYNDPETFEPQPLLAESWQVADDGLSIDITLRAGVTFHTGRPMTAEDVRYSFEIAALPATAAQTGFIAREFTEIEVTSDTALTIRFTRPLSNVFDFFEEAYIVDRETYDLREDGSQVVGTGPYRWVSWTPGAEIVLERYADYRDPQAAPIQNVVFAVITDPTAAISALRSHRASIATQVTPRDTIEFMNNPMYAILYGGGAIYPLGVDVTAEPFDTPAVRQAIGYAIDRERINEQVFDGTGTPTALFWAPQTPGYSEELAQAYAYDPDRARRMIAEAGAEGATVEITVPAIPSNRSVFEIVQNNLREVGLEPVANILDVTEYDQRQVAGELGQSFILIHGQIGFSPATLISSLPSLRQGNPSHFWTDQYVELRAALEAAQTRDETAAAVEALSRYMLDEAFSLALVQANVPTVYSTDLEGVELSRRGALLLHNVQFD